MIPEAEKEWTPGRSLNWAAYDKQMGAATGEQRRPGHHATGEKRFRRGKPAVTQSDVGSDGADRYAAQSHTQKP
jgi:hypothetical protein